jgi:Flp pilus assembly protein TadG
MKTKPSSERGQVLVIIAVAMIGLIGIAGLAIDGSRAFSDRRQAQNAADTAALAAALAYVRTPDDDWTAVGFARADSNGYDDNETTNFVDVYHPPVDGPYAGNAEYVQVIITSHLDTLFGRVVGIDQITNTVEAVAKATPPVATEMLFGEAIVSLAPSECKAFKYQGNANTTVIGGGLFVNSSCPDSAFFNNSGSASMTAPSLNSVGGVTYKPGSLNIPTINTGAPSVPYPPRDMVLPNIVCSGNATKSGNTLSPGNWTGTFPPSGVDNLESGVYCVNGDFRMNAHDSLSGNGVVISMESGEVRWNGGATINLHAPDTGPYQGLLLYMPMTNSSGITINGDSASSFTGTILAPASPIDILGSGSSDGLHCQVIGYTVNISGTSGTKIVYNDNENWDAPTPPAIELTQ